MMKGFKQRFRSKTNSKPEKGKKDKKDKKEDEKSKKSSSSSNSSSSSSSHSKSILNQSLPTKKSGSSEQISLNDDSTANSVQSSASSKSAQVTSGSSSLPFNGNSALSNGQQQAQNQQQLQQQQQPYQQQPPYTADLSTSNPVTSQDQQNPQDLEISKLHAGHHVFDRIPKDDLELKPKTPQRHSSSRFEAAVNANQQFEKLASFDQVDPEYHTELFIQKVKQCKMIFDFFDPSSDIHGC
ncbi:unnamed protein product [Ambrosiozyma monospora]|uniref:Unnamed protein product n=1 Tax=Ambrosiozyma monospora TaxID=43982 RepID=A0ACB5TDJ2_AMBMO|nr:unnamed protein product [Ambrosiozyma monospora]